MGPWQQIPARRASLVALTVSCVLGGLFAGGATPTVAATLTIPTPQRAANCGKHGLEVVLNDTNPAYVQDELPTAENHYVVQFYFNASASSLAGGSLEIFSAYSGVVGSGSPAFQVYVEATVSQGAVAALRATGVGVSSSTPADLTPGWHRVQVSWQTGAGTGSMLVTLDGAIILNATNVSNSSAVVDYVRMGALDGIGGSRGALYFDDFDSRRSGTIEAKVCQVGTAIGGGAEDTIGIYRNSDRSWKLRNDNSAGFADIQIPFGDPSDVPVVGDWNGDGNDTVGIYRDNVFRLRNSNSAGFADLVISFGAPGDIPVTGDWNGDGIDTIGVYRPSTGGWFLRNSNSSGPADLVFLFGLANETPLTGDWDGDGVDTIGIFRASDRTWRLRNSNSAGGADIDAIPFGDPATDIPITGDWDGDGIDTFGVYRPAAGSWHLRNTNTAGYADITFTFGVLNEKPVVGDWDAQ